MFAVALAVSLAAVPRIGVIVALDAPDAQKAIVDAVVATKHYAVVPGAEMKKHLDAAASLGIQCALDDAACLAKVGAFAKTPFLLAVSRTSGGARAVFVDATTSLARTADSPLPGNANRALTLHALVAAVVEEAPLAGSLAVASEPGAAIEIDGVRRGNAPVLVGDLPPGPHAIVARASDGRSASLAGVAYAGVTAHVNVALPDVAGVVAQPSSFAGPSPLLVSGIAVSGTGIAALAATTIAAVAVSPTRSQRPKLTAKQFNDGVATGQALAVGAVASGVVVLAGAALIVVAAVE